MHVIIAFFFALVFSTPPTSPAPRHLPADPGPHAITMNDLAPTRAEFEQARGGSVYAGTGCISCNRTNVTYSKR